MFANELASGSTAISSETCRFQAFFAVRAKCRNQRAYTYYEGLRAISPEVADAILAALNDVAADDALFRRAKDERVMGVSLMRSVNERTISGQFRRLINGEARLTSYEFNYRGPAQLDDAFDPVELSFSIEPFSKPPTNIQVIVGRRVSLTSPAAALSFQPDRLQDRHMK